MNIYVGNLHYSIADEDLKQVFSEYGEISSVRIINDRETGRSKGFGFVEMPNDAEANNAIEELDGAELMERTMRVNESKPKTENRNGKRPYEKRERRF